MQLNQSIMLYTTIFQQTWIFGKINYLSQFRGRYQIEAVNDYGKFSKDFSKLYRLKTGVASSLNYVNINDDKSPVLHPYPSWKANTLPLEADPARINKTDALIDNIIEKNNSTIISTSSIRVDECDRLWVLDFGATDLLETPKYWAPITIAVFDLKTDNLIRRFTIPPKDVKHGSFMANIVR